jgi:hypothetical protein
MFQCHYIIILQRFFWRNVRCMFIFWTVQLPTILKLGHGIWIWMLICDTLICRMNVLIWKNEHWTVFSPHSNNMTSHHNSSLSRLVVTGSHDRLTWYKILYQHTMNVIGIYFTWWNTGFYFTGIYMINFIILMWTYFDEIRELLSNKNLNYIYYIENIFILLFAIAMSCDAINSNDRQDLIQSLVQTHYVCNKFI